MIKNLSGAPRRFTAWAFVAMMLAACSAGVSPPATPVTPGALSITPSEATLYSELPTSFVIGGGTPPYFVTSSDQATVPVIGTLNSGSFTVVPSPVAADTPVTLTVRDSAGVTPVTASLVVKPRTVSNVITVRPSAGQSAACGTAICAGGDAEVAATLAQNGVALIGRTVRFDVVSGDFRIITSPPGVPEALSTSATTTTDLSGTARMRIRVLSDASAQTGLLQISDVSSGSFQRTAIPIAPSSSSPLNAQPGQITFSGSNATSCASGISADVIVFGGRPPYLISRPGSVTIDRDVVTNSGGRFTVTATGQCVAEQPIAIVDGLGATVTVTVSNNLGIGTGTPITVTPRTVTLSTCDQRAGVSVAGGSGTYRFAVGADTLDVLVVSSNQFEIRRRPGTPASASPLRVGFTDGRTVDEVTVNLSGTALGACPGIGFTATPTTVTLNDCSGAAQVTLSGGSGSYTAASNHTGLTATVSGNVVSIRRTDPSGPFSGGTVNVSDGASTITITVNSAGAGAGACPTP